jgi:hypothetical protein
MASGNPNLKDASATVDQTGRGDDVLSSSSVEHQPAGGHRPQRRLGRGCEHHFSGMRTPGTEVDQAQLELFIQPEEKSDTSLHDLSVRREICAADVARK